MILKSKALAAILLSWCCAVAFNIVSCSNSQTAPPHASKKPADVRVMRVTSGSIWRTLDLTGSVEPFRKVQLASPAEGPVVSLKVREGDFVRKGDTLLTIGRQEGLNAQIRSLVEDVQKEEASVARAERLAEIDGDGVPSLVESWTAPTPVFS